MSTYPPESTGLSQSNWRSVSECKSPTPKHRTTYRKETELIRSSHGRLLLFLTLSIVLSTSAQVGKPGLVDVHVHYNGEPDVLRKLLGKLEAVNGMAILLTTPAGLPTATKFIKENPTRFVGFGDVKLDDPKILDEIDRFHQAGFRGLGEITSTLKNYDDRSRANRVNRLRRSAGLGEYECSFQARDSCPRRTFLRSWGSQPKK